MNGLYYVQDSRFFLGNTVVWHAWEGGYTPDINKAKVFTAIEAKEATEGRDFDIAWDKDYVDQHTQTTVDMRDIDRRLGERSMKALFNTLPKCVICDDMINEENCQKNQCNRWKEKQNPDSR